MMINQIQKPFTSTVSLTSKAHQLAEQFCSYHSNLQKSEQVYFNTLAIYAVNHYLQCMGFTTDWKASSSYDIIIQSFLDIADLEVINHGKLECRFVLPDAEFVYIPQEVWTARIGYIVVQLDESLETATLLGFAQRVATEKLPLNQLRTLAEFPQYLQQVTPPINLSEWFEDILQQGWQTLESLLTNESVGDFNLSFKDSSCLQGEEIIKAVKRIELDNQSVLMLVALKPEEDEQISIRLRIYPDSEENSLPENIKLAILSDTGKTLKEVTSRSIDNFIQLPIFRCNSQESFQIQLSLNNICFTESFFV
ncbi:DUF1822 family protein [Plectonema cf. radiosum LEGE 06105]|uniref:DUF1822 family protein n=1 Tax=Plectonema cf. radiosum LEGE 06105 TaxID=945769 RepID=A0A8J7F5E1_9CYAN|nr:DUF1822 family protein [Plectonema radiosum]MBE9215565.1 DUF1822 family protein [Plectonema cf. radiosum LEGE 06105]